MTNILTDEVFDLGPETEALIMEASRGPAWCDTDPTDRPGEEWLPCRYFRDGQFHGMFEVSSAGRVRSVSRRVANGPGRTMWLRGRVLRQCLDHKGYPMVGAANGRGSATMFRVHVIGLSEFQGPRPAPHFQACHNDDVATNNRAENLRWGTDEENKGDRRRNSNPDGYFMVPA